MVDQCFLLIQNLSHPLTKVLNTYLKVEKHIKSNGVRGTNAVYKFDGGKDMCGMRVKLTWTFNGARQYAPIFITVSGLNDTGLPPDKDFVILKVQGLCIGGVGVGGDTQL